ncbi:MAG: hypothetical protein JW778_02670 [Candidatus Altiarchaeota archaeon]|nr:hypothetical protein [Candidatus Altiarchaeota archaeon]
MAKIGVLELRSDRFTEDVVSGLQDYEVEFLSFGEQTLPIESDLRVVVDRLSYCDTYLKEIVKNLALDGTYVINNPFSSTTINKILETKHFKSVRIQHPKTFALPKMDNSDLKDIVHEPDWDRIAGEIKFPCIIKPFDGYAWTNVYKIESLEDLRLHHDGMKNNHILLVQNMVDFVDYYRVFCIDKKDVLISKWNPKPFDMGKYIHSDLKQIDDLRTKITKSTIRLNKLLDLDINTVEWCITEDREAVVIEAFNEVPDIVPAHLPQPYYKWLVEKFSECIIDKYESDKTNKTIFRH